MAEKSQRFLGSQNQIAAFPRFQNRSVFGMPWCGFCRKFVGSCCTCFLDSFSRGPLLGPLSCTCRSIDDTSGVLRLRRTSDATLLAISHPTCSQFQIAAILNYKQCGSDFAGAVRSHSTIRPEVITS